MKRFRWLILILCFAWMAFVYASFYLRQVRRRWRCARRAGCLRSAPRWDAASASGCASSTPGWASRLPWAWSSGLGSC